MNSRLPAYVGFFLVGGCAAFTFFSVIHPGPVAPARVDEIRPGSLQRISSSEAEGVRNRLRELGRDPYLRLTPDELTALASAIDLTQESNVALLNQVLDPALKRALWKASVEKAAEGSGGKRPDLLKLFEAVAQADIGNEEVQDLYRPLLGPLRDDPQRMTIFEKSGHGLLIPYLSYWGDKASSLKDAMAAIPPGYEALPLGWRIRDARLAAHPDAAHFQESLDLVSGGFAGTIDLDRTGRAIMEAQKDPGQRAEMVFRTADLPASRRNDALLSLGMPADDQATQALAVTSMTSATMQSNAIHLYLYQKGATYKTPKILEAELQALPDSPAKTSALEILSGKWTPGRPVQ